MMILNILKIIGIVLACIVGLILLLVLLVLFIPVTYRLSGAGEGPDINAEGKGAWLFHALTASLSWMEKSLSYKIRLFGIPLKKGNLFPQDAEISTEQKEEKSDHKETVVKETVVNEAAVKETVVKESAESQTVISEAVKKDLPPEKEEAIEQTDVVKKEKEPITDRIEHFIERIEAKLQAFQEKMDQAERIVTSPVTQRALKKIKEQLFAILNHIKPKKIAGNLNFGLEDPANTAIIYGTIDCIAEGMSGGKLILTPEFYQKGISLDMVISGRFFIGYIALCALKVIFNKDVKKVVRVIRRYSNG